MSSTRRLSLVAIAAAVMFALASSSAVAAAPRTPIVFFPGYGTTVLRVTVHNQTGVKGCPRSGSFEDGIPANVGTTFSQVCRDELITPRWKSNRSLSFSKRFSLPAGVKVSIPDYGQTTSAPVYNSFFAALEAAGYDAGRNLVVAGYDFRLTPDLNGFLSQTKRLIVRTWRLNHKRPVRIVGHSNGPLYAQYLLTHVSAQWKHQYIQGFTDIAGNLPGQGSLWTWVFTGVEVPGVFSLPTTVATARSSARLMALSPATWMSAVRPVGVRTPRGRDQEPGDRTPLYPGRHRTPATRRGAGLDQADGRALPRFRPLC